MLYPGKDMPKFMIPEMCPRRWGNFAEVCKGGFSSTRAQWEAVYFTIENASGIYRRRGDRIMGADGWYSLSHPLRAGFLDSKKYLETTCSGEGEIRRSDFSGKMAEPGRRTSYYKTSSYKPDLDIARLEKCIEAAKEEWKVDIYLEPGEAWALNAGFFLTTVLDVLQNGDTRLAILDGSAACHMPDVLEMPYRPPLLGAGEPGENAVTVRLGGPTCLSGDVIGDYSFQKPLAYGDLLVMFGDMAERIYNLQKQYL